MLFGHLPDPSPLQCMFTVHLQHYTTAFHFVTLHVPESWTCRWPACQLQMAREVPGQARGCVSVPHRGACVAQGYPVLLLHELVPSSWALLCWTWHEGTQIRWKVCTSSKNFAYVALCDSSWTQASWRPGSVSHRQVAKNHGGRDAGEKGYWRGTMPQRFWGTKIINSTRKDWDNKGKDCTGNRT